MRDKNSRYNGYNRTNLGRAKVLRKEMTKQEKHLWYDFLKEYPLHFYRQRPIDHYIADFYCTEAKLVIELDGDQHGESKAREYDSTRTEVLRQYGLEVIRFANEDIDRSFESVCHVIHETVKNRLRGRGFNEKAAVLEAREKLWDAYAGETGDNLR